MSSGGAIRSSREPEWRLWSMPINMASKSSVTVRSKASKSRSSRELAGTRRRFDNRLLLAHLARLDRCVEDDAAVREAARFDELVALVAGAELPEAPEADAGSAKSTPARTVAAQANLLSWTP
jgi:hypothetical protein